MPFINGAFKKSAFYRLCLLEKVPFSSTFDEDVSDIDKDTTTNLPVTLTNNLTDH